MYADVSIDIGVDQIGKNHYHNSFSLYRIKIDWVHVSNVEVIFSNWKILDAFCAIKDLSKSYPRQEAFRERRHLHV